MILLNLILFVGSLLDFYIKVYFAIFDKFLQQLIFLFIFNITFSDIHPKCRPNLLSFKQAYPKCRPQFFFL